ncbi:MAG: glutathione S-transferase [Halobacteriovoraceae bacterium]|nr:glutathione S-transferase [Halobacteriovoraceae bacterium]|tara:strand:+ start:6816 stop:7475 length:660 start_codon:yes stop_codon:yes gene_type:complete
MKLNLISFELCPYVQRSIIVLLENDIMHERTYIDLSDKPDWFKKKSPLGKVPILETPSGILFESNVICEYLNEISGSKLHPDDSFEKARNRSWIEYGSGILSLISKLYNEKDEGLFFEHYDEIREKLDLVTQERKGIYFNGEKFMIVDAVYATIFRYFNVIAKYSSLNIYKLKPDIKDWRNSLFKRPSVEGAVINDFDEKLLGFYLKRKSYLSSLLKKV